MMQKLKMHPDLGGDELTAKWLNEAQETLLDPLKRAQYDQWLNAQHLKVPRDSSAKERLVARLSSVRVTPEKTCLICGEPYVQVAVTNSPWQSVQRCKRCAAPLREPQEFQGDTSAELRNMQRIVYSVATTMHRGWPDSDYSHVEITNFSLQGAGAQSAEKLRVGEAVLLKSDVFEAVARVTRCQKESNGKWTAGVRFHTLHLQSPPGRLVEISC